MDISFLLCLKFNKNKVKLVKSSIDWKWKLVNKGRPVVIVPM